jgi:hypothetical protein
MRILAAVLAFVLLASPISPTSGLPCREKATAPAFASLPDIA